MKKQMALFLSLASLFTMPVIAYSDFDCEYCAMARGETFTEQKECFTVIRLGAGALSSPDQSGPMTPSLGIARRYEKDGSAVEVSASYAAHEMESYSKSYYYSIPRILYLQYSQPQDRSTFFYGAGLSWGAVVDREIGQKFRGIIGDVALGYEMQRDSTVRAIVQLDIAQPLIASKMAGDLPPASMLLTLGVGF